MSGKRRIFNLIFFGLRRFAAGDAAEDERIEKPAGAEVPHAVKSPGNFACGLEMRNRLVVLNREDARPQVDRDAARAA